MGVKRAATLAIYTLEMKTRLTTSSEVVEGVFRPSETREGDMSCDDIHLYTMTTWETKEDTRIRVQDAVKGDRIHVFVETDPLSGVQSRLFGVARKRIGPFGIQLPSPVAGKKDFVPIELALVLTEVHTPRGEVIPESVWNQERLTAALLNIGIQQQVIWGEPASSSETAHIQLVDADEEEEDFSPPGSHLEN